MRPKPVEINGVVYESARAAARYIVEQEALLGNMCKENTVHKELKRCWPENGGGCWYMYDRWLVTQAMIGFEAEALGPSAD